MTGAGAPDLRAQLAELSKLSKLSKPSMAATELRVGVVAAQWHEEVMAGLLGGCLRALDESGISAPTVVRVPGAFELPVAALRLATAGHEAVVCLGVVVRGGTPHFDYVCQAATVGCTDVALRTGVPVGFGVLTCDTDDQARDRAGLPGSREDKGAEAALAAVATALALRALPEPGRHPRFSTLDR